MICVATISGQLVFLIVASVVGLAHKLGWTQ